jgi:hypothetical protein
MLSGAENRWFADSVLPARLVVSQAASSSRRIVGVPVSDRPCLQRARDRSTSLLFPSRSACFAEADRLKNLVRSEVALTASLVSAMVPSLSIFDWRQRIRGAARFRWAR